MSFSEKAHIVLCLMLDILLSQAYPKRVHTHNFYGIANQAKKQKIYSTPV